MNDWTWAMESGEWIRAMEVGGRTCAMVAGGGWIRAMVLLTLTQRGGEKTEDLSQN
jgi:hypothetical protein